MKKRIFEEGIFLTFRYYKLIMENYLFSYLVFGRTDIHISSNSRLSGIRNMKIGKNFSAGCGLWMETIIDFPKAEQRFTPSLRIGDRVSVGEYVHIGCNHRIVIGDDVLMGSKIYITDHNHGVYRGENLESPDVPPVDRCLTENESVEIGDRCWIGEFVTILPGVTIGEGCIIGSHSTVTHDIPAGSIAVGSPAKVIKVWNKTLGIWAKL